MYIPENSRNGPLKSRTQAQKLNRKKVPKPAMFDKLHAGEKEKNRKILTSFFEIFASDILADKSNIRAEGLFHWRWRGSEPPAPRCLH